MSNLPSRLTRVLLSSNSESSGTRKAQYPTRNRMQKNLLASALIVSVGFLSNTAFAYEPKTNYTVTCTTPKGEVQFTVLPSHSPFSNGPRSIMDRDGTRITDKDNNTVAQFSTAVPCVLLRSDIALQHTQSLSFAR